jgi:dipeptidyl aminopeptidase/acylaminoacyl peptidase
MAVAALACAASLLAPAAPVRSAPRPLAMDDVLALTRIDRATISPDGEWVAVVVQRGAGPGEVYGRTLYEFDPSRGDVWLVSRRSGEKRNLTNGQPAAAGFWCATWSPDGSKIAMLSTRPEGKEPRGGDNVRLYVWDRATGTISRMSDAGMVAQTMGGSPIGRLDLRGGADESSVAHRCSDEENAPFAWLDNRRLLAVTLPSGGVSSLIDAFERPVRHAEATLRAMRSGAEPTFTAVGSGAERTIRDEGANSAVLRTVDVATRASATVATVPTYPFRGELTLSIAPSGRRVAVLATVGTIPPAPEQQSPSRDGAWATEKRLGFIDLAPNAPLRWVRPTAPARYPLELYGWSPDSRAVALRARDSADAKATPLFVASADTLSLAPPGAETTSVGTEAAGSDNPHPRPVLWVDEQRLLARVNGPREDWWLIAPGVAPIKVTANAANPPAEFRRSKDGSFVALVDDRVMRLNLSSATLEPLAARPLPGANAVAWPEDPERPTSELIVAAYLPDGGRNLQRIALGGTLPASRPIAFPTNMQLFDAADGIALARAPTPTGLFLRQISFVDNASRDMLALNRHFASVDWGKTMLIDYRGEEGQALKAAVILPPGYKVGQRYPVIVWVYAGYRVAGLDDYWLDPYLPGFYNLQLYAANGYVVLIPSMPIDRRGPKADLFLEVGKGALPAVDRLIDLGIGDKDRLGVMGQSRGGYSVYSLVTQTSRFKAAVAMAGITDLAASYVQFDASARGYPGIEHEKSDNWSILPQFGLGTPPDRDYARYWRNSPLAYVDRVDTPLLMIHGEYDNRNPMAQAETFFYSLYRQGKTARLLRYWGEDHGLSESPGNMRSIFDETIGWFDKYLGGPAVH